MAWLPVYATENDLTMLLSYLNGSDELAFIVSNGPSKWIAVRTLPFLKDDRYCIWHISSGPLPLFRGAQETPVQIANPFAGWTEAKAGADSTQPYFGAGHPGVFWLNIRSKSRDRASGEEMIGLSSFEWIGNHYKVIGSVARPETQRAWKALGRWIRKNAIKVPRGGPREPTPLEIWALQDAQARFESGVGGGNV